MNSIDIKDAFLLENSLFIDVRSPSEFALDHISGAINIPIFSDEERAIVGTIYKKESQKSAVDKGVEFFSKKLPLIVETLREHDGKNLVAYCWRGGMRSKAFVSFLHSLNFNIVQLTRGYKAFRTFIRERLYSYELQPKLYVIYGMTGTAKTEIIKKLMPHSIDLEELAGHRSSLFGHVGLSPRSQKMFENMLFYELERVNGFSHLFLEGESRKIGNVIIPDSIFSLMKTCNIIKVHSDVEVRAQRIVDEYFDTEKKIEQIRDVLNLQVLSSRLGPKNIDFMKSCLDSGDYLELVIVLLEKYYDPMYKHSQKILQGGVEFSSNDISRVVEEINASIR